MPSSKHLNNYPPFLFEILQNLAEHTLTLPVGDKKLAQHLRFQLYGLSDALLHQKNDPDLVALGHKAKSYEITLRQVDGAWILYLTPRKLTASALAAASALTAYKEQLRSAGIEPYDDKRARELLASSPSPSPPNVSPPDNPYDSSYNPYEDNEDNT